MNNKIVQIIILVIIAVILTGLMLQIIMSKNGNFKIVFFNFGTDKLLEQEFNIDEVNSIKVNATSSTIKFEESYSEKVKITMYGINGQKVEANINDSVLDIRKESNVFGCFFCYYNDEIIVEIPKNYDKEISIKVSSGDVSILDLEKANINVEYTSGNIKCGNVNNANICGMSGNIEIGNGNEMNLKATSGRIQAGECKRISAEVKSGDIKINKVTEYCRLSTTSGNIKVEECNIIENSSMKVKSGNISILSVNDVYVDANTTSGNVKVTNNNHKADIELKLEATSGNITVK